MQELRHYALFAEMLDYYLNKQGILPAHLAAQIFVEPAAISQWRKNKRLPESLALIHKIACALALSPPEHENLAVAWCNTRQVRDLIPYLEEALRSGDSAHACQVAQVIIGNRPAGSWRGEVTL